MASTAVIAAKILRRAKELLNNGGLHWHQGSYTSPEPMSDGKFAYCALGACRAAEGELLGVLYNKKDDRDYTEAERIYDANREAEYALLLVVNELGYQSVPQFNDDPFRKYPEVVSVFDRAVSRMERTDA